MCCAYIYTVCPLVNLFITNVILFLSHIFLWYCCNVFLFTISVSLYLVHVVFRTQYTVFLCPSKTKINEICSILFRRQCVSSFCDQYIRSVSIAYEHNTFYINISVILCHYIYIYYMNMLYHLSYTIYVTNYLCK